MQSCDDGTNTSYCKCTYDWLDNNLTNQYLFMMRWRDGEGYASLAMVVQVEGCR